LKDEPVGIIKFKNKATSLKELYRKTVIAETRYSRLIHKSMGLAP